MPRCLDDGDVELLHRHHRMEATLCTSAPSRKPIGQRARGALPAEAPAVLAPTARAFRAAIADDRVPVTVRLFLTVRRDLEGKGLGVPERRAAVEAETGNAHDRELDRQHIALLAARIVTGSLVNSGHLTIRKGGGVETRRLVRVFVEPQADRVLWLHVRVLLSARSGRTPRPLRRSASVTYQFFCGGRRLKLVVNHPTFLNHNRWLAINGVRGNRRASADRLFERGWSLRNAFGQGGGAGSSHPPS